MTAKMGPPVLCLPAASSRACAGRTSLDRLLDPEQFILGSSHRFRSWGRSALQPSQEPTSSQPNLLSAALCLLPFQLRPS